MFFGKLLIIRVIFLPLTISKEFCQPHNESCWPSTEEISIFKNSLMSPNAECLENFPTFTSKDEPGTPIYNHWQVDISFIQEDKYH